MTFDARETSTHGGEPKELFRFVRGEVCWLYTSADVPTTLNSETYLPVTISRGEFERNEEQASSQIEVRMDRALAVVPQFIDGSSPFPVELTLYRIHRDDAEAIVLFKGIVANAKIALEEIIMTVSSPLSSDEKSIPRELILRTCPHVLYGNRCTLDPEDHKVETTVSSIGSSPNIYNLAADGGNPDGFFAAGVLVKDATGQRGFIQKHVGLAFTLLQPMVGLVATDPVTIFWGCDRVHSTCRDKFDNIPNFGGFPLHPQRNPFIQITL